MFKKKTLSKIWITYCELTKDLWSCGTQMRILIWLRNPMQQVWQKNEDKNAARRMPYFKPTINSPSAPKIVDSIACLALYVLLITAPSPAQIRMADVAIRVDAIIQFRRDWIAITFSCNSTTLKSLFMDVFEAKTHKNIMF